MTGAGVLDRDLVVAPPGLGRQRRHGRRPPPQRRVRGHGQHFAPRRPRPAAPRQPRLRPHRRRRGPDPRRWWPSSAASADRRHHGHQRLHHGRVAPPGTGSSAAGWPRSASAAMAVPSSAGEGGGAQAWIRVLGHVVGLEDLALAVGPVDQVPAVIGTSAVRSTRDGRRAAIAASSSSTPRRWRPASPRRGTAGQPGPVRPRRAGRPCSGPARARRRPHLAEHRPPRPSGHRDRAGRRRPGGRSGRPGRPPRGRLERLHQVVRQLGDEPDGVGEGRGPPTGQVEAPVVGSRSRTACPRPAPRPRTAGSEGRLAGVGVADQATAGTPARSRPRRLTSRVLAMSTRSRRSLVIGGGCGAGRPPSWSRRPASPDRPARAHAAAHPGEVPSPLVPQARE